MVEITSLKKYYEDQMKQNTIDAIKFRPEDEFWQNLIRLENLIFKGQLVEAEETWHNFFEVENNFVSDMVRLHILLEQDQYKEAQNIQIYWQKIMDKLDQTEIIQLYFGFYYYYLGLLYFSSQDYEVAIHYFGKADSYFIKVDFHYAQFVCHGEIAMAMQELGAYGDARYHLREQLRRDGYIPTKEEAARNFISQGQLYVYEVQLEKAMNAFNSAEELLVDIESTELSLVLTYKLKELHELLENPNKSINYQQVIRKQVDEIKSSSDNS